MLSAILLVALPSLLHSAFAQTSDLANVTMAFSTAMIVPDVISSFNPVDGLNITFTDPVTMEDVSVIPGSLLTMEQTAMESEFFLTTTNNSATDSFVLMMIDPDAPTPQMPNVSQFLHFLGGDFSADSTGLLSNTSAALMDFFPPTPPEGSDPHRYVLLVFSQPTDFDMTSPMFINSTSPRTNFSASDFAQSTNLGSPIAGNFFFVGPTPSNSSASTSASASSPASAANSPTIPALPMSTLSSASAATAPAVPSMPSMSVPTTISRGISIWADYGTHKFALAMVGLIALALRCL